MRGRRAALIFALGCALSCGSSKEREPPAKRTRERPPVTRPEDVFGTGPSAPARAAPGWQDQWEALRAQASVVGSQRCKGCHEQVGTQAGHHMAQTSRAIDRDNQRAWFSPRRLGAPYASEALPRVRAGSTGVVVAAVRPPARGPATLPVDFLFGSRTQFTPLAVWDDRRIVELGVSYYVGAGTWAKTPGHDEGVIGVPQKPNASEHCLFCHTTAPVFTDDRLDLARTTFGIQCERCHGPGSLHVETALDGGPTHIFNPGALAPREQVRFCGQCHGRPATAFPPFVLDHDVQLARFSSAALMMSDCFRAAPAASAPTCTECHDAHDNVDAAATATLTQASCLRCHPDPAARHSTTKVDAATPCAPCHMPARPGHERPGVSYTDHWIHVAGRPAPFRDPARRDEVARYLVEIIAADRVPAGLLGPLRADAEEWRARWPGYLRR